MPLADKLEKTGFIARLNSWSKGRTGKNLTDLGIVIEQQIALPINNDDLKRLVAFHD